MQGYETSTASPSPVSQDLPLSGIDESQSPFPVPIPGDTLNIDSPITPQQHPHATNDPPVVMGEQESGSIAAAVGTGEHSNCIYQQNTYQPAAAGDQFSIDSLCQLKIHPHYQHRPDRRQMPIHPRQSRRVRNGYHAVFEALMRLLPLGGGGGGGTERNARRGKIGVQAAVARCGILCQGYIRSLIQGVEVL